MNAVHPSSLISASAELGNNVSIGAFSIIHDNVALGDNCTVGAYCEIGIPTELAKNNRLVIGSGTTIRSHSTLYIGSVIGNALTTGHYVMVRENSTIGEGCQFGNRADIQGDCTLGNYVKTHADVHIGKESIIGHYVWLFPEVLLTNDPTPPSSDLVGVKIDDFVVVAAKCLLMPGVHIHKDAVISAGSVVTKDVPEGKVAQGNPAKIICDANILRLHCDVRTKAYPWRHRYNQGYPQSAIEQWSP